MENCQQFWLDGDMKKIKNGDVVSVDTKLKK